MKRIADMLRAGRIAGTRSTGLAARREAFAKLMRLADVGKPMARIEDLAWESGEDCVRVRIYTPAEGGQPSPAIIFFHGGGFVAGSLDTHEGVCRSLAHECRAKVLAVGYRLAPEHAFPAAVVDACAAARAIAERADELGIDAERIAVAGDSAGGCLAAVVCQELRKPPRLRPVAQLLLCPITDFGAETASRTEFADGYVIDRATIESDLQQYLGDADTQDPRVSPLRARDFSDLPPAFIHTAQFDPMRDEGAAYAERLAGAGIPTHHTCHAGMIHLFYAMTSVVPYAQLAMRSIGAQMQSAFERQVA